MLTEADLPVLGEEVAALHFSCISLVPEPCGSTYEALMRREKARRVIMLDPNIRADFIADRQAHLARMKRMLAMADVVKLSAEDLAWFGESGSVDEVARRWLDLGPKAVVVTRGSAGAIGYAGSEKVEMPALAVEVADTVGAGDTFNAGLLASLYEQGLLSKAALARLTAEALGAALEFAMRAAAVTVSRPGANPPWRHEMV